MAVRKRQPDNRTPPDADLADPRVQAWAEMAYAYHRIARRMEQALDADGLTLAQFEVLVRLHLDGAISQSVLAARLLVTKGNISGLLNRMAKANLVRRQSDRADRRAHKLIMTKHGQKMLARTFPKHIDLIHMIMRPLNAAELDVLRTTMMQLAAGNIGAATR
jgi:DNA-binding MarR family transcriptional regulator